MSLGAHAVNNPVRRYIWAIVITAVIAVAGLVIAVIAAVNAASVAHHDLERQQKAFCGLVDPISQQHSMTELGDTIVGAAQRAVLVLHCPTKGNG